MGTTTVCVGSGVDVGGETRLSVGAIMVVGAGVAAFGEIAGEEEFCEAFAAFVVNVQGTPALSYFLSPILI